MVQVGVDLVWGLWGLKPPYPLELHGVNREGEERRKKEIKKKRGTRGRQKIAPKIHHSCVHPSRQCLHAHF
jgi:hypothetical protein